MLWTLRPPGGSVAELCDDDSGEREDVTGTVSSSGRAERVSSAAAFFTLFLPPCLGPFRSFSVFVVVRCSGLLVFLVGWSATDGLARVLSKIISWDPACS